MKKVIIIILILLSCFNSEAYTQQKFSFKNGKFRIAQFTDVHWDNKSNNCKEVSEIIRNVLNTEKPDLAILTGDVVTEKPSKEGWHSIISIFEESKTPFIVTLGNHDGEVMEKEEILNYLLQSPYYAGEQGPTNISGYGNCVIPVYASKQSVKPEALLYCIDSNDYQENKFYGSYDQIHFDQIQWYRQQSEQYTKTNNGKPLPALAFFHIPLPEYKNMQGDDKTYGNAKEGIASSQINSGMFASLIDMKDVMGVFVGHDHNNDFIGINKDIALAYGRVTGLDSYGELNRGARIIELYEGKRKFDTYIATPSGCESIYYYPSGFNSEEEQTAKYLPAINSDFRKNGVKYTYYKGQCKRVADISNYPKVKEGIFSNFTIDEADVKDYFAYDFRTMIYIPEKGVYRFYTYSDDGSVVYIDGKLVVDNDGGHSARRREGKVALEKGFHEMQVLYFENYMGEVLEVGISSRNLPEMIIPNEMLYLPE